MNRSLLINPQFPFFCEGERVEPRIEEVRSKMHTLRTDVKIVKIQEVSGLKTINEFRRLRRVL